MKSCILKAALTRVRARSGMWARRRHGLTVVDFALMAPLVFLLIFGFMQAAIVFSAWIILNNEAREGARLAAVAHGQFEDFGQVACDEVFKRAAGRLDTDRLSCEVTEVYDDKGNAEDFMLRLDYPVPIVIPLAEPLFGGTWVPLAARSSMRLE